MGANASDWGEMAKVMASVCLIKNKKCILI